MTAPDAGQAAEDTGNQPRAHINPDMSGSHRTRHQAHMRTERRLLAPASNGLSGSPRNRTATACRFPGRRYRTTAPVDHRVLAPGADCPAASCIAAAAGTTQEPRRSPGYASSHGSMIANFPVRMRRVSTRTEADRQSRNVTALLTFRRGRITPERRLGRSFRLLRLLRSAGSARAAQRRPGVAECPGARQHGPILPRMVQSKPKGGRSHAPRTDE
jgi:hypothetical protein